MNEIYCGIELKGNDAILVILRNEEVVNTNPKKITLVDSKIQKDIHAFVLEIIEFMNKYKVDKIGIKERATKGRFSGGSVSFKMEALIQSTHFDVSLIHGKTISSKLKNIEIPSDLVLKYQENALQVAYYLSLKK